MEEIMDLTPAMAIKPSIKRCKVDVPVGFVMPEGTVVEDGFSLLVEYGARWHPEWPAPKITVNAWYIMPQGDAVGWAGDEVSKTFGSLMPDEVTTLSEHHGEEITKGHDIGLGIIGIGVPPAKQALSTFLVRRLHEVN